MEVNLVHNGYNVERRKMYPANPRNNLVSTVDLVWRKSLEKEDVYPGHQPQVKKQEEKQGIQQSYTRAVESVIEKQSKMDKSSFRVMPVHPIQSIKSRPKISDSLADELKTFQNRGKSQNWNDGTRYQSQSFRNHIVDEGNNRQKPIQNSSNVSSTVFGYDINYEKFKRESYFSKLMSDRLEPYLSKSIDGRIPKYSSFHVNNPVPIYYQ